MSKRVRGTRRPTAARAAARPGRREALIASRPPNELAEAIVPNALAGDPVSAAMPSGAAARVTPALTRGGPVRTSALAARAATEYVYVGQDLRHIGIMAGVLGTILAILFVIIDVAHLIQL